MLTVSGLRVLYKTDLETVNAVNGISFAVHRGETLGLVGETGAGKTTTALSIMKLLPERTARVVEGAIRLEGMDLLAADEDQMRRIRGQKIAMVFQDPMTALNPVISVGNQIAEALILHNPMKRSREEIIGRVEELLNLVGIPAERKRDYPFQFSGGMRQRVVIAIALACQPSLLIADEPTTALDVTIQAQVIRLIKELRDRMQMSMIMITHDLGLVAAVCDRVAVMYAGEIVEDGTVKDIFTSDKHHPYTQGLFGSLPSMSKGSRRLQPIRGMMPDPTALPPGCHFAPRCPQAMDICHLEKPPHAVQGSQRLYCHLFGGES